MNRALFGIAVIITITHLSFSNVERNRKCGPLYLTVTANTKSHIIINWKFTCEDSPDTFILCATHFKNGCHKILAKIPEVKSKSGTFQTNVVFGYNQKYPGGWNEHDENPVNGTHCYSYWIISLRKGEKVDENCIKIEPTWMARFGKLKIRSMMIPGTHNSGAWTNIPKPIKNYVLTQDRNLWGQLVSGIRFFDLRIGHYSSSFWINHDFVFVTPLLPELNHVLSFLKKTSTEIVVLNFHRFPSSNFSDRIHLDLLDVLYNLFKDYILPPFHSKEDVLTLEQMWKTGKRLILSYNYENMYTEHSWLWAPISRKWGDISTVDGMYTYLKKVINSLPETPYVIMAEQTPTIWTFFKYTSFRSLADTFNPLLNSWLRNENWDEKVNMVAVDFFMSSDIIDIAIEANEKRLKNLGRRRAYINKIEKTSKSKTGGNCI